MLFRRCLTTMFVTVAALATTACTDLTRPNEITIKAEPPTPVAAAPAQPANGPAPAPAAPSIPSPGGGG